MDMERMRWVLYNDRIVKVDALKLGYTSNWAKFAPGFFETMKVYHSKILFWDDHYKRMTLGAKFWCVKIPKKRVLRKFLLRLVRKNKLNCARLRIQFNASLEDDKVDYFANVVPLQEANHYTWIKEGWKIGVYREHYKLFDGTWFKSNNRNIYLLGKKWATTNSFDDALVLNINNRVADSTACNVFWVKDGEVFTPSVTAGGVDGTFSKFLKRNQKELGVKVGVKKCSLKSLKNADEIFLTNVIRGIRWVREFEGKQYDNQICKQLFEKLKSWESSL